VKIKTDEITSVIKQEIEQFSSELEITQVGRVVEVGDGIARIYGLSQAMAGELLEFDTAEGAVMGQVMNLELDTVGAVIYGNYLTVREGDNVKSTGNLLEIPAGEALLGRVVDPLGVPLDGGPPIETGGRHPQARHRRPRHRLPPAGQGAAPDRSQGHRLHDPHRPRPA
jgi:F-type H+-transporting ATPase subunit alpha